MADEASNMNGGHATEEPHQDEHIRPSTPNRILLAALTFLPALLLLSIINYTLTQLLLVTKAPSSPPPPTPPVKMEPKIVTKTVYIQPSESDLARLRSEIEASDPLPPTSAMGSSSSSSRSGEIESVVSSLQSAMEARNSKRGRRYLQHMELTSAHSSFVQRFDEDVSNSVSDMQNGREHSSNLLMEKLSSFKSVLSLVEFSSVEHKNLTDMVQAASTAFEWLLQSGDEGLFLNDEEMLREALVTYHIPNPDECSAFLHLNHNMCDELSIPAGATIASKTKTTGEIHVPEGTARESDLYRSVEGIKEILSKRDAKLIKTDADGSLPSPLGKDGTADVIKEIYNAAVDAQKLMQDHASQKQAMRQQWMTKVESSMPVNTQSTGDDSMCATSDLVEQMVEVGLESLRKKSDLSRDLRTALFSAIVNKPNFESRDMKALQQDMQKVGGVKIDYETKKRSLLSGKKSNRKSVHYLVDGPLLHRGVTGWINSIVDFVSGYDDNIDALLDWIVGDSRSTVGEIIVDKFLKVVRLVPFNEEVAERFKSAGILAGRTRTLLED